MLILEQHPLVPPAASLSLTPDSGAGFGARALQNSQLSQKVLRKVRHLPLSEGKRHELLSRAHFIQFWGYTV